MSLAVIRDISPSRHQRHLDIREVIAELRRDHPRMGEQRLATALRERVETDERLLIDLCTVVVRQTLSNAKIAQTRRQQNGKTVEERAQHRSIVTAEVKQVAARVKLQVLDMIMPNGERLRFCRGSDCAQWGVGLARIAEKVGPDCLVGEVLCEREAQELLRTP